LNNGTGHLYVVAAPSGGGKTSLVNSLIAQDPKTCVSVSHTTRPPRPGEVDGVDYHFVSRETFQAMAAADAFLEHAQVHDYFYGTAKDFVHQKLSQGLDVILEIDWQGARQIRQQFHELISIFILPPSMAVLASRLAQRGQDGEETIALRLRNAKAEIAHFSEFDYLIKNDVFVQALTELQAIFLCQRLKMAIAQQNHAQLLASLLTSE
jgi:guanylate kinase